VGKELETDWILAVVEYLEFGNELYYQDYYASFTITDHLSARPGRSLRSVPGVRLLVSRSTGSNLCAAESYST
jgi:hypothetical protein